MITDLDETHDPARKSWVASANEPSTDFPIQNLPFCLFGRPSEVKRAGVAIGSEVLDLNAAAELRLLDDEAASVVRACSDVSLNPLMATAGAKATQLRQRLSALLAVGSEVAPADRARLLVRQQEVAFYLPAAIGGFTDFFTSLYHTERSGRASRPDDPVPLNFRYMPIAYNSRASSVRVSGEPIRRPHNQRRRADGEVHFGPCESLDFELELGAFIGKGNDLGDPIDIAAADDHVYGYCLLNDWSARDIQRWESFPLGPFLAKTLSTSISPFVITADALRPFRTAAAKRPDGDPAPMNYLLDDVDQRHGGIDLKMEAYIQTDAMRKSGQQPFRVAHANFRDMYWTVPQMIAHHASNGCNLRVGDLLGSGTVSGPSDDSRACLAEIVVAGDSISFPNGERRKYLEDGDSVIFRARAERDGYVSIGFGECSGRILPATSR